MALGFQNFYETTIASPGISDTDLFIPLALPPTISEGWLLLDWDVPSKREFVYFTSKTASGVNVPSGKRGLDGTTAVAHAQNAKVRMNVSAGLLQDVTTASSTALTNWNNGAWASLPVAPTVNATNGNRSIDLQYTGVNYTDRLSKGMRLLIPRTGTAVQTQVFSGNGTTNYWNKTSPAGMTFTDDFCAGAWVKLSSYSSGTMDIISRWNGTSGWSLELQANTGQVVLEGWNAGAGNVSYVQSHQSIPLNRWVFVAAQLDMSAFTATTTTSFVMIDGVDVPATVGRAGTNPTSLVQAGNLEIGSKNGGTNLFPGKIAQAFVSSAKITQANIRGFMNAPITSSVISANSIISAYDFANNSNDLNTTNANNLTAQGSATATNADSPFNANAYAIIMSDPVYSGGNTTCNVQYPEGYPIPNATLGTSSYSSSAVPYGFPRTANKWRVSTQFASLSLGAGSGTYFSGATAGAGTSVLNIPTGEWAVEFSGSLYADVGAAVASDRWATLSTSATAATDNTWTVSATTGTTSANTFFRAPLGRRGYISTSASTPYYVLAGVAGSTSNPAWSGNGSPTAALLITADNALL